MELISNHQIYYSNKDLLPLSDVAESLLALEKLIKQSPKTIEKFFPGLKIYLITIEAQLTSKYVEEQGVY